MNRLILTGLMVSVLVGCSSAPRDPYERRAYEERQRQERATELAIDRAPKWMTELPRSSSAVYENGTATSIDMGMAVNKAKTMAFGKICMAAGGRVDQQSKIFRTDTETSGTEFSELAIRSFCPGVDISGAELVESKMYAENGRFRVYVLVALPTGEANAIVRARDERENRRTARQRSDEAMRELDQNSRRSQ